MRIRKNGKVIRLTESDLRRITKKVLREQTEMIDYTIYPNFTIEDKTLYSTPSEYFEKMVEKYGYNYTDVLDELGKLYVNQIVVVLPSDDNEGMVFSFGEGKDKYLESIKKYLIKNYGKGKIPYKTVND